MSWTNLSEWWLHEVTDDPAYQQVVTPMLLRTLQPQTGAKYLDVGCGEGRVMRSLLETGAAVVGLDASFELAALAAKIAPTVVGSVPHFPFTGARFDGAYAVLVLEHLDDISPFFAETARVVRSGGVLAVVLNHPVWTAPGSTPITDADDEVLWRPGEYFSTGSTEYPAEEGSITFHHRSMADLLNAAADAGWALEQMEEQPHHEFEDQSGIPRLLSCRWRLIP